MESSSMFLGRKNQYYENDYTTKQTTDSVQYLSHYQWHFYRSRTKNFTIHVETHKTPNSQREIRMELEESTFLTLDYTTKLQS